MLNNILICVTFISIIIFGSVYFISDNDSQIVKPTMNTKFHSILASNEHSLQQALSEHLTAAKHYSKPIPKSLDGIDLNIHLPLDADGNLIIGMEVKDLFEIYLSAMGEEELDDIILRIQSALAQQLHYPALEQGYDALKRFIDYKIELANLDNQTAEPSLSELENISHQKEVLAVIQQEYFSPIEVDALFSAENQYDDFMLKHLTIQQNEYLTREEKDQATQALESSLPENIRAGRVSAMAPAKIYEQAKKMKIDGSSDAQIYQMRSQSLGQEAATALARLDQQRDLWQQRLDSFKTQYKSISSSGLSAEDQIIELNSLLVRNFNTTESIRVRALTGIH
jgi:lipase chaperone LimK